MKSASIQKQESIRLWIASLLAEIIGIPIRRIDSPKPYRDTKTFRTHIRNMVRQIARQEFENSEIEKKIVNKIEKQNVNKIEKQTTHEFENSEIENGAFARTVVLEKNFTIGGPSGTGN